MLSRIAAAIAGAAALAADSVTGQAELLETANMSKLPEFTDENFRKEVLESSTPVLVDFWAPWCGPCRMIAPLIDELASENTGAVKVGKLNIDNSPAAAQTYGVISIPTLMIFNRGQVVERFVGMQPKAKLQEAIDAAKA